MIGTDFELRRARQRSAHDRTMAEIASFLCRDENEVRQKAKELGLVEQHVRVVL